MHYKLVILFVLLVFKFQLIAQPSSTLNGVSLVTGQVEKADPNQFEYTYYKDNRVKSVKDIKSSIITEFTYLPRGTAVIENQSQKNIYLFTDNHLISGVEHYQKVNSKWELYRTENLFWNDNSQWTSRVLKDSFGNIINCTLNSYNAAGKLIKETIYGNLTGTCSIPIVIQENGIPLPNGVESFSQYYDYTPSGLVLKLYDDQGKTTYFDYNKQGKCIAKLMGNQAEIISRCFYEYDSQGLPSKVIVDDGKGVDPNDLTGVTSRQIMATDADHNGQPLMIENQYLDLQTGLEVTLDKTILHSAENAQVQSTQTPSATEDKIYLPESRCTITRDCNGNETKSFHDSFGRVINIQLPPVLDENEAVYQPQISHTYDICNHVISIEDANGHRIESTYTVRGKPVLINYPDGTFERFTYFLNGELREKIARNGSRTVITQDSFGRTDSLCEFSPHNQLVKQLTYSYQGARIKSITNENGSTIALEYDGAGQKTGYTIETASEKRYVKLSEEEENQTRKPRQNQVHTQVKMTMNTLGQFVKLEEVVDQQGTKYCTTYDALDRPEQLVIYNSLGLKLSEKILRHNANNQKVVEKHFVYSHGTLLRTFIIHWEYDASNNVTAIHEGVGSPLQKNTYYQYDISGNLIKITKPNGLSLHYDYNSTGQIIKSWASDQSLSYEYIYDDRRRLVEVRDLIHKLDQYRQYNEFDQLTDERCGLSTIHYEYDSQNQCTRVVLPDGSSVKYTYENSLLTAIDRIGKDGSALFVHDLSYDKESKQLRQAGFVNYTYDHENHLIGIHSPWWSEGVTSKNDSGRITSAYFEDLNGKSTHDYTYTTDGQLASDNNHTYSYDSLYNRLSENGENWTINEMNQLVQNNKYQLKYDQNGNLVEKTGLSGHYLYSYDALDRLIKIESDQHPTIEYSYDAFNRRIAEKTSGETHQYLYLEEKEIGRINEQGQITELRVIDINKTSDTGSSVAFEISGRIFSPIHDRSGSVRCLIDINDQSVAEFYRYSSFGDEEILDSSGNVLESSSVKNPWRYLSKRVEDHSHLVFFGLRYYDPEIGRWITPDPLFFADTPNVYAFMKNDSLNHCDQYGLFSLSSIWEYAQQTFSSCINYLRKSPQLFRNQLAAELHLSDEFCESINQVGQNLLGEITCNLLGNTYVKSHTSQYGEKNLNPKVRITYINGVLNNNKMLYENLDLISDSHGGTKVHYVFRGTKGWTWDMAGALSIKFLYIFGYRSSRAHNLAEMWRNLIEEMGGIDAGGLIIHYAHSLGGSDTDRARTLLTPEEQKMIRVFTFGSSTLIRNEGFESVINIISPNDAIPCFDPLGHIRNYFDPNSNVRKYGHYQQLPFWGTPIFPCDHLLNGYTYRPIVVQLGEYFQKEFATP